MLTKETNNISDIDFQAGQVILIDKPLTWTSFRVVRVVRKFTKVKRVGHAGTLDPLATGLLIVCTGKKTKEISEYQSQKKFYEGIITLGKSSASLDLDTEVICSNIPADLTEEKIYSARNKFLGEIEQIPPMFSALKHNGKALYKLARAGKEIERAPRKIEVYSFKIKNIEIPDIHFEIACSKGTYIRSIADDFGKELGTRGILSSLRRTAIGDYKVEDAVTMEKFETLFNEAANENRYNEAAY
jgi:tRNA pseudouridine55 synthase